MNVVHPNFSPNLKNDELPACVDNALFISHLLLLLKVVLMTRKSRFKNLDPEKLDFNDFLDLKA